MKLCLKNKVDKIVLQNFKEEGKKLRKDLIYKDKLVVKLKQEYEALK